MRIDDDGRVLRFVGNSKGGDVGGEAVRFATGARGTAPFGSSS